MKYYYEKPAIYIEQYGQTYKCDHPVYSRCTLYFQHGKGLAVIQQRFNKRDKSTYWTEIDPWLVDDIYKNPKFQEYFKKHSGVIVNKLFPTVSVRQLMWALRMKPIKRERWETVFDHKDI